jgi:hypothetical protein
METLTSTYKKVGSIISDLGAVAQKPEAESVFLRHNVADYSDKIALLRECMGVIGTSDSGDELSPADNYSDELEIFCEGSWRFMR